MHLLLVIGVVAFIGIYYVIYFGKIKAAGGRAATGRTYWREQLGLDGDEETWATAPANEPTPPAQP